ncbi:Uma2 family endonuclease [Baaleninema simplex]|uniref:Uma2 family endonuclease n=1 Tax=Baaleninema simplex TaxID=2862350 RepID=UPI000349F3B7|nr:Uma2 family endonuclease [Baaleninema simplex]
MTRAIASPLSLAEFLERPETKPPQEYVNGSIFTKPMPQGRHSRIQQKLVVAIDAVTEPEEIALALLNLRCTFGDRSIVPDIAVFRWERIPLLETGDIADRFEAAPDWAIEILSPDRSSTRVVSNILHCLKYGADMGWLIDPSERLVQVCDRDRRLVSLERESDRLPTPEFAAELALTVGQIFGWLRLR